MKKILAPLSIAILVLSCFSYVLYGLDELKHTRLGSQKGGVARVFEGVEASWYDFKFQMQPPEIAPRVVVAEIDDASLARYGRWPWPRSVYGEIIENLYSLGAEVVAFDVVFSEPEMRREWLDDMIRRVPPTEVQSIREAGGLTDEQISLILEKLPKNGEAFFNAAIEGTSTVMGYFWEAGACKIAPDVDMDDLAVVRQIREEGLLPLGDFIESLSRIANEGDYVTLKDFPVVVSDTPTVFPTFSCPVSNRSGIAGSTVYEGYFTALSDADGVFRKSHPVLGFNTTQLTRDLPEDELEFLTLDWIEGTTFFPSLSLRSVLAYLDKTQGHEEDAAFDVSVIRNSRGALELTELKILLGNGEERSMPLDPDGSIGIRFFGSQNVFPPPIPSISLADIFERFKDGEDAERNSVNEAYRDHYDMLWTDSQTGVDYPLNNHIVFIGPASLGVYDLRPNPVDSTAPGVYLHATMASRMLQKLLDDSPKFAMKSFDFGVNLSVLWTLGILVALFTALSTGLAGVWGSVVLLLVAGYADYWLFSNHAWVFPAVTHLVGVSAVFAAILAYKYFTEGKDRAYLKGAFEKYVSPDLVDSIISDPKKLNLGGERKELSVLFSDVRGFTSISEKMTASELAQFMNDYLTPMTEIVIEERGTIDKYMGDAIMAIFGAPVPYEEHAVMAVRAGLRMLEKLDKMKEVWREQGLPPIDIGVGVNTGDMSVGNMGSTRIFSYTVMGDSVNLGSRLEGLTKNYGVRFIVSEFTVPHLNGQFVLKELDRVKVKGKQEPVVIHEVLCEQSASEASEAKQKASRFEAALELYYEAKFAEAKSQFQAIEDVDATAKMYVERCALWMETPPEEGWDGSWTMTTK